MEIHTAQADIADFAVDAVVVPCSSMGTINEGIKALITDKGGEQIEIELQSKAPLAIGAAMITSCPQLSARNVILVPIIKHPEDDVATELLRRAVKAALIAANMKRYETVALPPMIQQEGGPTISEATRAVVQELNSHKHPFPEKIYLVHQNEKMLRIFGDAVEHAQYSL